MNNAEDRALRFQAVRQIMSQAALDAIVVVGNGCVGINAYGCFRYLTDIRVFYHIASAVFLPGKEPIGVVDSKSTQIAAKDSFIREFRVGADQSDEILKILKESGSEYKRIGTCLDILPYSWAKKIREAFPGVVLTDISKDLFQVRNHHTQEEINRITHCGRLADAGYEAVIAHVKSGMTEQQIAAEIDHATEKLGAEYNFTLISNGRFSLKDNQLPCIRAATMFNQTVEVGDSIAMEITPRYEGYWAQLVRTVSVGPANEDLKRMHTVCNDVIREALQELHPGNRIGNIAKRIRETTEERGYLFSLPCGHVCGQDLNEERISPDNDRPLEVGMVVILHPSITTPSIKNGIFWGQTYLITQNGYKCLMQADDTLKSV